jgi:acid stress-induced BolA-like protein IbaG/YrbA
MNSSVMTKERIADLIRAGLPGATVRVESDDNTHFASQIVATQFAGLRPIARHQLVYQTLGALVGREIHALSIDALTPEEFSARG